jgi:hypothetical protein
VNHARTIRLGIAIQGDAPPDRFRIFTAGEVVTSKGTFIFDAEAADAVMAEYAKHGNDLMVDYDHASIGSMPVDPALASRAAGWFGLELATDGSLWAVNVKWTEPAAIALSRKEWRYMSPYFATENNRIVALRNVALTNMPATRRLEPLMAASRRNHAMSSKLTLQEIATIAKGLKMPEETTLDEFMAKLGIPVAPEAAPPAEEPAPEPEPEAMALPEEEPKPEVEKEPAKEAASVVAASSLERLTDKDSLLEQLEVIATWKASHLELESGRQKIAAERATLDSAERIRGCRQLVAAGRAPATVWADETSTAPKSYLTAMPIGDFRTFVRDAVAANGGKVSAAPRPPVTPVAAGSGRVFTVNGKQVELSERELAICASTKDALGVACDPQTFAALKARRDAAPEA